MNEARKGAGENPVRPRDFVARVVDELDLDENCAKVSRSPINGQDVRYFDLTEDQAKQVAMRVARPSVSGGMSIV